MYIDANRVKALRLERQWSQDELAIATGLSRRTIQRVESESSGSLQTLKALASVFSIDGNELLKREIEDESSGNGQNADGNSAAGQTNSDQANSTGTTTWLSRKVAAVTAVALVLVAVVAFGAIYSGTNILDEPALPPGKNHIIFTSGGIERAYWLYVPSGFEGEKLPLLIELYEPRGIMEVVQNESGFKTIADREGVVVAYPEAVGSWPKGWNTNPSDYPIPCCGEAGEKNIDDVGFIVDVKHDAASHTVIDLSRVYIVGKGAGGNFVHRLICEASDEFQAFAYINGYLDEAWAGCTPERLRPVKGYHGIHNPWVDIDGCSEARPCDPQNFQARFHPALQIQIFMGGWRPLSFQESFKVYADRYQCAEKIIELQRAGNSYCEAREGCQENSAVENCTIDGGHFINTNTDIHVAQDIWEFFSRY